jgi:hypothetical protein
MASKLRLFEAWIHGTAPMLQHRFSEDAEASSGKSTRRVQLANESPRDQAEKACYREVNGENADGPEGPLYFPGAAVARVMREAGSAHKQKGSRKSIKYIVPAAAIVVEAAMPLFKGPPNGKRKEPERITDFEVDSRPVVIPSTKGRIMRHRPRLDEWAARFTLRINEDVLDVDTIKMLLDEGGMQQGLGDFRPSCGGPFGTFSVVSWKEITGS